MAEGYVDTLSPEAHLQASAPEGTKSIQLAGTIRNGDIHLRDAFLVIGQSRIELGDLEPGQVVGEFGIAVQVSEQLQVYDPYRQEVWGDPNFQRRQFLETLLSQNLGRLTPGIGLFDTARERALAADR